jgi:hypothetical protein
MSGIDKAKISEKLYKQLDKKGLLKEIIIFRLKKSVYKEKASELYVCTLKGYYHKSNLKLNITSEESATTNRGYSDKFLAICDTESNKILEDDYFKLNGVSYKIIELGNIEDIIFDMSLSRM